MVNPLGRAAGLSATLIMVSAHALEEPMIYGLNVEQLEWRSADGGAGLVKWNGEFLVGSDERKWVLRNQAELEIDENVFESFETYGLLRFPMTRFYDVEVGLRADTPEDLERLYGVIGVRGTGPYFVETGVQLSIAEYSSARLEFEYEAPFLFGSTLIPSVELDIPLNDDPETDVGAWGASVEIGARAAFSLGYGWSAHAGIHYERVTGATRDIVKSKQGEVDDLRFVAGVSFMF